MKNLIIVKTILLCFFVGDILAQPANLTQIASARYVYAGTTPTNNNTGSDIAKVSPTSTTLRDENVTVYQTTTGIEMRHIQKGILGTGTQVTLGVGLGLTNMNDPDVVAVTNAPYGLGTPKEIVMVTYIGTTGGFPNVFLEIFHWDRPSGTFLRLSWANLTQNRATGVCTSPNIDADHLGNYAVVWEESGKIYLASENIMTPPGINLPTKFVDMTASCVATGVEPDVCVMPDDPMTSLSLINVSFRVGNNLYLERIWTSTLVPGLINYPAANCLNPFMFYNNLLTAGISDIRIACPPQKNHGRDVYEVTMTFIHNGTTNNDVMTATHSTSNFGMGVIVYSSPTMGFLPAFGVGYNHSKPVVAYQDLVPEFVVAWEMVDTYTSGLQNAYNVAANFAPQVINTNKNIVAMPVTDANTMVNPYISQASEHNIFAQTSEAVSVSKGDISPMNYTYTDASAERINTNFAGLAFKTTPEANYWLIDRPSTIVNTQSVEEFEKVIAYPNPAPSHTGEITVDLGVFTSGEIIILSIDGRVVYENTFEEENQISIENNLEKGTYLIKTQTGNNEEILKFVIN
ncbi:MAG: hypothetical protein CL840_05595 [Crocinitomicaceae bacterium]|nr:hypothetical protein [Crocinitomicaceae bacterium]|tara:strand:+ start:16605 stop:18323 length:1719 start_codon:yes stop_codon:yes gene_type:complete